MERGRIKKENARGENKTKELPPLLQLTRALQKSWKATLHFSSNKGLHCLSVSQVYVPEGLITGEPQVHMTTLKVTVPLQAKSGLPLRLTINYHIYKEKNLRISTLHPHHETCIATQPLTEQAARSTHPRGPQESLQSQTYTHKH